MEYMKDIPDKYFSLVIVDPPYGIGESMKDNMSRRRLAKPTNYNISDWDKEPPAEEYFTELMRVSHNQIIWGGNYFLDNLYSTNCMIIWDKENGGNDFADAEIAWTSFQSVVRIFRFRWAGMLQGDMKNKELRIHRAQKPIALYSWLLKNYAKEGENILDTHLGSGSSRIACHKAGFDFVGCEIDKDYFEAQEKRFNDYLLQGDLFKQTGQ
jgi:site-specific DNA-methyltransferase (adenine-specific)